MPITPLTSLTSLEDLKKVDAGLSGISKNPGNQKTGFVDMMSDAVKSVNQQMNEASKVSESFMLGEKKYDIHEVMISLEKADLSFRYMAQVRNKVLDAYNEIMRMQV